MPTATQPVFDFKVGDKVLYDFKEATIENLDEWGGSLAYGGISMGFNYAATKLFPVTDEGLNIVHSFQHLYDGARELPGARNLNYPAINEHVCGLFNTTMTALHEVGTGAAGVKLGLAMEFFIALKNELHQAMKLNVVEGVPLLRR